MTQSTINRKPVFHPSRGRKRPGFTLLEAGLVMAVAGVVLVAVLSMFNAMQDRQYENNTKVLVQALVSGTKSLYAGSTNYDDIGTSGEELRDFLLDGKKVPGNYIDGNRIIPPFNEKGVMMRAHSDNTFSITLQDVPTHICNALLSEYASSRAALRAAVGIAIPTQAGRGRNKINELDITMTSGNKQWTAKNIADQCDDATEQTVALLFQ